MEEGDRVEKDEQKENSLGINKGGLVSNNHNHGEAEVVDVTENIYYESADLVVIKEEIDEAKDEKSCFDIKQL